VNSQLMCSGGFKGGAVGAAAPPIGLRNFSTSPLFHIQLSLYTCRKHGKCHV